MKSLLTILADSLCLHILNDLHLIQQCRTHTPICVYGKTGILPLIRKMSIHVELTNHFTVQSRPLQAICHMLLRCIALINAKQRLVWLQITLALTN